jgi:predicted nucleotidyltransferase
MEVRSLEAIVKALNHAAIRYIIVGGIAVNAHGYVRMTRDVDIVLELKRENILLGLKALFEIGYQIAIPASIEEFADSETRERWRDKKNMIVLKLWSDKHGRTPIDIFIYEPFNFAQEFEKTSKMELKSGLFATIVSLEGLLAMKRDASRPQDLTDIEELQRIS